MIAVDEQTKLCKHCNTVKPRSDYYRNRIRPTGYQSMCKSCDNILRRKRDQANTEASNARKYAWATNNQVKVRRTMMDARLKRSYGLTTDQYNAMVETAGGVCEICGKIEPNNYQRLSVDHCHDTGRVRGVLCRLCNVGIGQFKNNPDLLMSAAIYLERNQKQADQ